MPENRRDKNEPHHVRCFEESESEENQYNEHHKTLGQALSKFARRDHGRSIIFCDKSAFDGGQNYPELNTFFPPSFWRVVTDDLNGTFGFERYEEASTMTYDIWSTFKLKHVYKGARPDIIDYHWSQPSIFTRQSKNKQLVIFIDCLPNIVNSIVQTDLSPTANLSRHLARARHNPFIWHALLVEELRVIYEKDVWNLRHIVRDWEKMRSQDPNVQLLNDIGRHLIHTNEVFEVTGNTIDSIVHHHKLFHDEYLETQELPKLPTAKIKDCQKEYTMTQQKLLILGEDIKAIRARAAGLYERLRHEINLAYHVAARTTTQMSIDIAQIARRDNATMKALALIGILYLPGTFISGIFGMSFFNYNPANNTNSDQWLMSDQFWIYWAVTIPVTLFTVLLWAMLDETVETYKKFIGKAKEMFGGKNKSLNAKHDQAGSDAGTDV